MKKTFFIPVDAALLSIHRDRNLCKKQLRIKSRSFSPHKVTDSVPKKSGFRAILHRSGAICSLIFYIFFTSAICSAQFPFNIGGTSTDIGYSIATDGADNTLVTGSFIGTADFDPSAATANLTSVGGGGIFVAKYNSSGVYQWAFKIGYGDGRGIVTDAGNNILVTGNFSGTVDFDPSAATANLTATSIDIFVAKYNSSGVYQWAFKIGGSATGNYGWGIATDGADNIIVTGDFTGTADFDPSAATANLTSAGSTEIFVAKYNSSGIYQWAFKLGNWGSDRGYSIATDGADNILVTGNFTGTADFDPSAATANLTSTGADIFVAKYNSSGVYQWAFNSGDIGLGIATDAGNNVLVTGVFSGTADFDPSAATANLTSAGSSDIVVAKYNSSGVYQWAFNIGSTGSDFGYGIATDGADNILVTGQFEFTADFDPSAATANLTSAGGWEIYVAKYNSLGAYQCAFKIGSTGGDRGYSIATDGADNILVTGYFELTADFDPSAATANLTATGAALGGDIYVAKYDMNCNIATLILNASVSATNIICNGQCAGTATANASGGTTPYTYLWNTVPVQTTITATGLCAGNYTATVTDAASATSTATVTITQPALLTAAATATNVNCNGGNNGSATVTAGGGTPSYTYSWNPSGQTTSSATGLSAGNYTVIITDNNNCATSLTVTIIQPTALSATTSATQATCGNNNGSATVTATGGSGSYTYLWSNGGTISQISNLTAQIYTVTITDANSCTQTATAIVNNSNGPTATLSLQINVLCNGGTTGSATVTASGGTSPYTYNWSPSGGTNANAIGLIAGNYTATVTDASGCSNVQYVTITQPAALSATTTTTQANCVSNIGSATVNTSGGTGSYTYSWSAPGGTTATVTGLNIGSYTCTITDANGCTQAAIAIVSSSGAPFVTLSGQTNILCNGAGTASASVTVSGGTPGYTYSWSPSGGTTSSATGLSAGNYVMTVTDGAGCSNLQAITITQPIAITATASSTPAACGNNNGLAAITANGGTGTLAYLWNPSGQSTSAISNLAAGTYTAIITDANGCIHTATVAVTAIAGPTATAAGNVTITQGQSTTLSASGGGTYSWNNGQTDAIITVSPPITTIYCVTVTDANGCTDSSCVTVFIEPLDCSNAGELYLPNAFSPNNDGENDFLQVYYGNFLCIKSLHIVIFNRWGEKIYESSESNFKWDGTYNKGVLKDIGAPNTQVYVYSMKATLITGEEIIKKGNVSLIR